MPIQIMERSPKHSQSSPIKIQQSWLVVFQIVQLTTISVPDQTSGVGRQGSTIITMLCSLLKRNIRIRRLNLPLSTCDRNLV